MLELLGLGPGEVIVAPGSGDNAMSALGAGITRSVTHRALCKHNTCAEANDSTVCRVLHLARMGTEVTSGSVQW